MDRVRWQKMVRALCFLLTLSLAGACQAHVKICSPKDAEAADAAVDVLDSWPKVQWIVKKYGHCDDGSIAEGNSEAVARLLVDHWSALPQLATLAKSDPALKRFVLRHIDTTLDTDDLARIESLALSQCPKGGAPLCGELAKAAAHASR